MNQLTFVAILSIVAVLVFFLHFPIILLLNRPEKEARPGPVSLRGKVKATHTVRYESKTVKDEELSSLIDRFPLSYAKEAEAIRKSTKIHIKVKNGHLSTTESRVESDYEEKDGKPDVARIKRHVNTTLVTALLDIGRGEWEVYQRPLKKYHDFMKNVLSLKVPMVVFVDEKSYAFVIKVRRRMGLSSVTKVWKISMTDLPLFQYHNYVRDIIAYEKQGNGWQEKWDPRMKYHPEASSSEYNIVVNSKPYFLYNTTVVKLLVSKTRSRPTSSHGLTQATATATPPSSRRTSTGSPPFPAPK
ncbi:hypothetical protein L596_028373 [Steinernema carpocapsae]|uniref:Uncharacterized protein n=1 Tax=Steinernema carpocapsae TaxID=34508 RepID=A0A4U5LYC9_STECR|nr:hypothetical protein L596_028373 [Steinernema carpocapsae]